MKTTWRVKRVTATEGKTEAELVRVEWFKRNPEYDQMMADYDALVETAGKEEADRITAEQPDVWIDEFLDDVQPDDDDAEFMEPGHDAMTIDITGGLDLHPGDNVIITLDAVARVSA